MTKVFRKAFRIVREVQAGSGKNFIGIFASILHGFWPFSMASLTEPCSFWYGLKDLSPQHYPECQRLFMRAFRVRSNLKKWPAPSVEHVSACSRRNKAPRVAPRDRAQKPQDMRTRALATVFCTPAFRFSKWRRTNQNLTRHSGRCQAAVLALRIFQHR